MSRPLEGVRVVEVAQWAFVPVAGAMLADMGASVIKVEDHSGDPMRALQTGGSAHSWELYNRGKRSVALDLKAEGALDVLHKLLADADYQKAAKPFVTGTGAQPSVMRVDSSLLQAFPKYPKLTLPQAAVAKKTRIYEIRTYESPSDQLHQIKMEQMQAGEAEIFQSVGAWTVFFADTLVGSRLPKLTYMLGYEDLAARDRVWTAFAASPAWKELNSRPRYTADTLVSNITNEILTPTPYSQI